MTINFKEFSDLLKQKGKIRGNPVAVTLFRESVPQDYEPIQDTPCSIIRYAMDEGRKVYFDAEHHDCLVGVHHAGIVPGKREIVAGEYLSRTSTFFTYEGAARLKSSTPVLPPGMVRAIGASPLDRLEPDAAFDWIVCVCNPHHANFIAGGRLCSEGVPPGCSFGPSLCGDLFASPWHLRNFMVVSGDFGGRMHNRIKQQELFVVIPFEYMQLVPKVLLDMKVDVKKSRSMTKPAHSSFWLKQGESQAVTAGDEQTAADETGEIKFTMPWDENAQELLKKVPEGILEMVVTSGEEFARGRGYEMVSRQSLDEQMKEMGMDLQEMLDSV